MKQLTLTVPPFLSSAGRVAVTLVVVCIAVVVAWNLWAYYQDSPRTRDGTVRASVVTLAADVAGQVVEVDVHDDQAVHKGDVLFRIDPTRYELALNQAKGALANAQAVLTEATHQSERSEKLGTITSASDIEQAATAAAQARAAVDQADAALKLAQINLDRTKVVSPVNGTVTNLALTQGSYVGAGSPVMALVDADSYYVAGYFEETKLPNIHVGDRAKVYLMGESRPLTGHVVGISPAIADPYRSTSSNLLPSVSPTFTWVRLAQRIPVNVKFDNVPDGVHLVAGRTASVDISPS